jgi:hypothetical protein
MTNPQDPFGQPNVPPAAPPLNESELRGAQNLPAPTTVQASFWLWVVTVVISLVGAVVGFTQRDAALAALRSANVQNLTDAQIQAAVTLGLAVAAVFAIVFAGLYLLFAFKARAGRNWARITLTVLTVLRLLSLIAGSNLLAVISVVVAVVAVVLLFLPASNQFFAASKRPAR